MENPEGRVSGIYSGDGEDELMFFAAGCRGQDWLLACKCKSFP